jgi:hypothetical protein
MAERKTTKSISRPSQAAAGRKARAVKGMQTDSAQVAQRAYERYLQRGGAHGHDLEDWLAAEQELRGS